MIKAVIFDMDGVIIDSEPDHIRFEQQLFKSLGFNVSLEYHNKFVGTTSYYMWNDLKNKYSLKNTVEELVKNDRDKYYNYLCSLEKLEPIKGVRELIKFLHDRGYKLAVASSSPLNVIERVVKLLALDEYFDYLVTGDFVKRSKPAPDVFLYAAEKLGVKPNQCIVIEDSSNGVSAAKEAGMLCIGYKNLNSGDQNLNPADLILDDFMEKQKVINLINGNK